MLSRRDCKSRRARGRHITRGCETRSFKYVSFHVDRRIPADALPDREEGFRALFKGGPARIIRSSPQFAFTLMSYEMFKKLVGAEALSLTIHIYLHSVTLDARAYDWLISDSLVIVVFL